MPGVRNEVETPSRDEGYRRSAFPALIRARFRLAQRIKDSGMLSQKRSFIVDDALAPQECHAATLAQTGAGTYCAAWFAGSKEGAADVSVYVTTGGPVGWRTPERIVRVVDEPHWNPVLFADPECRLHLFYKTGAEICRWRTWITRSADGGRTWEFPRELVPGDGSGGRGPVKNKPIRLDNGDWLAPASVEGAWWEPLVDRSRDGGEHWLAHERIPLDRAWFLERQPEATCRGAIQPTLWQSGPGRVHMLLRSTAGVILRSDSADGGATWCEAYPTALPNNNSGIDLARLLDGRLLLAYNPDGTNWGPRNVLRLSLSDDNGASWQTLEDIECVPADTQPKPEFSYPAVIATDRAAALCYTWNRRRIAFLELSAEDLDAAQTPATSAQAWSATTQPLTAGREQE